MINRSSSVALGLGLSLLSCWASANQTMPVEYQAVRWNRFLFHTVSVDLTSEKVQPAVVHGPRLQSAWDMIRDDEPVVAITGTFFNTTSAYPVGDVVIEGRMTAEGQRGSVIGVTWLGEVEIFDAPFQQAVDWSRYRFALRGALRVVTDGRVNPNPLAQQFRDPRLTARAQRCAIGTTQDGRLVVMATPHAVTLTELGKAMVHVGIRQGISMDGGSSACLIYRGVTKVRPGRKLSNMFVVHERSPFLLPSDPR